MTQMIFTGTAGFLFIVGFSLFFVWLDERSKKRARKKMNMKFQYFDKYYAELEKESERQQEKIRKERMEILAYEQEEKRRQQAESTEFARFSGRAAF